ncbi:MAG: hypothetical protein J6I85_09360 [Clostridia bacterium]|nr:hypothetical protein [Clostridia bacterium]
MKRNLVYNGKNIREMNLYELSNQYKINKIRFIYRNIFFILIALSIAAYEPIVSIIPIIFAVVTDYWLIQNNSEIKKEIEIR